jgi:hypothetical protein
MTCMVAITVVAVKRALEVKHVSENPSKRSKQELQYVPFESSKGSSHLCTPAHSASAEQQSRDEDCVCDEAAEPEEHGDRLDSEDCIRMRRAREEAGRKGEERDDDEGGPDPVKD